MKVKLIAKTVICDEELLKELKSNSASELMMYVARVSNPDNQTSGNPNLLKYCAKNAHWSVFEQANMTIEIETSRTIARQILRHSSLKFQEFSQRYSSITPMEKDRIESEARRQDLKNRQNSIDNLPDDDKKWFRKAQVANWTYSQNLYQKALKKGIAKECARVFLPEGQTKTRMYVNGSIRSWIHFLQVRCGNGTQLEHQEIANAIKKIFIQEFPEISKALEWID